MSSSSSMKGLCHTVVKGVEVSIGMAWGNLDSVVSLSLCRETCATFIMYWVMSSASTEQPPEHMPGVPHQVGNIDFKCPSLSFPVRRTCLIVLYMNAWSSKSSVSNINVRRLYQFLWEEARRFPPYLGFFRNCHHIVQLYMSLETITTAKHVWQPLQHHIFTTLAMSTNSGQNWNLA